MNEDLKLREARYFLRRMNEVLGEPEEFQFNLSAFLSAARSVSQYVHKEASHAAGGQKWYDDRVSQEPLVLFFKTERDSNVHVRPVPLDGNVDVFASDGGHLTEHAIVEKRDAAGRLIEVVESVTDPVPPTVEPPFHLVFHYELPGWAGPEEVPELCQNYLIALTTLVTDGRRLKWLTA